MDGKGGRLTNIKAKLDRIPSLLLSSCISGARLAEPQAEIEDGRDNKIGPPGLALAGRVAENNCGEVEHEEGASPGSDGYN